MINFLQKNKYKLALVLCLSFVLFGLSSCRFDASNWYSKPYTSYGQEWVDLWAGGSGLWNAIWAWPINVLSFPIAWICNLIGTWLGNSYFWGIFFTTIIVRTLAWPIYSKQNGMSLKMQLMQPEMAKIQRKYQGRQDPRSQQQMQLEMTKLYKKYKVNPLGCMTTMFLQFPIFMSMYEVVQRVNKNNVITVDGITIEYAGRFTLENTKLFGFFEINTSFWDATAIQDKLFALVVALLFGGITILQQKLGQRPPKYQKQHPNVKNQQQTDQQKTMKTMMLVMNVMFVFMSLSSTALAIYWLIGGIYQIFQSFVGRKINERNYEKQQKENI